MIECQIIYSENCVLILPENRRLLVQTNVTLTQVRLNEMIHVSSNVIKVLNSKYNLQHATMLKLLWRV